MEVVSPIKGKIITSLFSLVIHSILHCVMYQARKKKYQKCHITPTQVQIINQRKHAKFNILYLLPTV